MIAPGLKFHSRPDPVCSSVANSHLFGIGSSHYTSQWPEKEQRSEAQGKIQHSTADLSLIIHTRQINRVLRAISEPLAEVPIQTYISQITAEIEAEEKLEVAKSQENSRPVPEKMRRIVS